MEKTLPFSDEREKASAREQIGKIEERIRKVRKDLRSEKGILKRVGEMERKEQKVGMTVNVTAFRENDVYRKKQQKG